MKRKREERGALDDVVAVESPMAENERKKYLVSPPDTTSLSVKKHAQTITKSKL